MYTPFPLGDAEELRSLLKGAGFVGIAVRIGIGTVRFPSLEEFVTQYMTAAPLRVTSRRRTRGARTAFLKDVSETSVLTPMMRVSPSPSRATSRL